jgi:prepilin-type N-terminal cleavage/methylation domain-containing protein
MKKFFYKLRQESKPSIFKKNNAGFTLLEMVVSVAILVGAVMGPIAIAVSGINAAMGAKNRNLANYLAMEALEVLKNKQYTNFMATPPSPFGTNIKGLGAGSECLGSNTCQVDAWTGTVSQCNLTTADGCKLKISNGTHANEILYNHTSASNAPNNLKRYYQYQPMYYQPGSNPPSPAAVGDIDPTQFQIIVTVTWTEKGSTKTVTAKDYFQNWGGI